MNESAGSISEMITTEVWSTRSKTCSQCHFVNHKSHTERPGTKPGPLQWWTGE